MIESLTALADGESALFKKCSSYLKRDPPDGGRQERGSGHTGI